ncbi:MAG: hypothetical protein WCC74_02780 [Minisyncoccia bacterium]
MNLNSITQETLQKVVELTEKDKLFIEHRIGFFLETSPEFSEIDRIEKLKSIEDAMALYKELVVQRTGDVVEMFFLKKLANMIQQ